MGLCNIRRRYFLKCCVEACLDVCPIDRIVVADAKDGFLNELVPVMNSPDDYINGAVRSVALLYAISPRLYYCNDKINDTLCESDTGSNECQMDQKLRPALVFNNGEFRPLGGWEGCKMPVNDLVGVRRVFTVETSRRYAHLQRRRHLSFAGWALRLECKHARSEINCPIWIHVHLLETASSCFNGPYDDRRLFGE